jgi:heme oxygenase|tara:strand:+ start:530 stop:643 length:114 start_codon:yes stop_codon:yes gene_type:complete
MAIFKELEGNLVAAFSMVVFDSLTPRQRNGSTQVAVV